MRILAWLFISVLLLAPQGLPSPGPDGKHLCPLCLLLCTLLQLPQAVFLCAHFTNEETEAQRGDLTFPRPCR